MNKLERQDVRSESDRSTDRASLKCSRKALDEMRDTHNKPASACCRACCTPAESSSRPGTFPPPLELHDSKMRPSTANDVALRNHTGILFDKNSSPEQKLHKNVFDAQHHIEEHLKKHPHEFKHVFDEIKHLHHADPKHFHRDLKEINEKLHKDGYLPHMQIIDEGHDHFAVVADSDNPKHAAVVSKNYKPKLSSREAHTYKHMHHNGWHDSATGGGGGNGGYDSHAAAGKVPTGSRKELIDEALKLAGLPVNAANEAAVNLIVQRESGWNPNAINLTDKNARAGHPSQGLMQTVPGTFHRYALAGYNSNIDDPLSNLVAGIRYSKARYGSLQNVPGVRAVASGKNYVGY